MRRAAGDKVGGETLRRARARWRLAPALACALTLVVDDVAAAPPSAELMAKLGKHAAALEQMRTSASYTIVGRLEAVDGDGKTSGVKELEGRVEADGKTQRLIVDRYREDGTDKTEEGRDEARKRQEKRARQGDKSRILLPTLPSEQASYVFDVVEADPHDVGRIKISFVPREPDERRIEGQAWVDARAGTILSAGFKLSKTSLLVDWVHFKVAFGAPTPLGPAPSRVEVEGKGGLLFLFRKHFRGAAELSSYRLK